MSLPNIIQQINSKLPLSGGTIDGDLTISQSIRFSNKGLIQSSNDEQYKSFTITSENVWSNEVPFIVMRKIDATNNDKGTVYINAGDGTKYSRVVLNADGSINHDGRPIVSVTKWTSGTSGYRKYADGFIEQWGVNNGGGTSGRSITFPLAFSNTNYNIQMSVMDGSESDGQFAIGSWSNKTASSVKFWTTYNGNLGTWTFCWYACGY